MAQSDSLASTLNLYAEKFVPINRSMAQAESDILRHFIGTTLSPMALGNEKLKNTTCGIEAIWLDGIEKNFIIRSKIIAKLNGTYKEVFVTSRFPEYSENLDLKIIALNRFVLIESLFYSSKIAVTSNEGNFNLKTVKIKGTSDFGVVEGSCDISSYELMRLNHAELNER